MRIRTLISVVLLACLTSINTFAQTPPRKKKIKDFGSSLKRLKWNPQKKAAVDLQRIEKSNQSGDDDVVRISTALVTSDLLVLDKHGNNVPGLTGADFEITEEGEPQKVDHFVLGSSTTLPRTIVLIIDYSGSQRPYLENSVAAAKLLVDKLGPYDQMAIVTDDIEMVVNFTTDKKKLKKQLDELIERATFKSHLFGFVGRIRFGKSAQYSALLATLREAFDEFDMRPIVVFQTDGDEILILRDTPIVPTVAPKLPTDLLLEDERNQQLRRQFQIENLREFSIDDVYRTAEESRATIYTVIPGVRMMGLTPDERVERIKADNLLTLERLKESISDSRDFETSRAQMEDRWKRTPVEAVKFRTAERALYQSTLAEVSALTGGWTEFLETPAQAGDIYSRIFSDINQRYIIGYYPTNKDHDGKRRTINFAIKGHPDYQILGRRSYFAPAN
jgi:VWFA-related protein